MHVDAKHRRRKEGRSGADGGADREMLIPSSVQDGTATLRRENNKDIRTFLESEESERCLRSLTVRACDVREAAAVVTAWADWPMLPTHNHSLRIELDGRDGSPTALTITRSAPDPGLPDHSSMEDLNWGVCYEITWDPESPDILWMWELEARLEEGNEQSQEIVYALREQLARIRRPVASRT